MTQSKHRLVRATTGIAAVTLTAICGIASPASARQDLGPTPPRIEQAHCGLARVATQYVSCDNLTGNGVPAPAWVSQL